MVKNGTGGKWNDFGIILANGIICPWINDFTQIYMVCNYPGIFYVVSIVCLCVFVVFIGFFLSHPQCLGVFVVFLRYFVFFLKYHRNTINKKKLGTQKKPYAYNNTHQDTLGIRLKPQEYNKRTQETLGCHRIPQRLTNTPRHTRDTSKTLGI